MKSTAVAPAPASRRLGAGAGASYARRFRGSRGRDVGAAVVSAALVLLWWAVAAAPAAAEGRVALVIGNAAYDHAGVLANPGNDATDVGAALRRLGFDVTPVRDAGKAALEGALADFADASAGADVALVFYAGHGLEVNGANYLVPVDARLESDTRVRFETVPLDYVLAATAGAGLRVVILDACRNNPLARSMRRSAGTRSASRGAFGELDEGLLGDETLVAYSAAAGTVALDGAGRNSPYASALLEYLEQPLELGVLFRRVRSRVLSATDRGQRPHEYASLLGEHYLHEGAAVSSPAAVEAALGLDRASRRTVQRGLSGAGFSAGTPDGVFGPSTRSAIRAWQASRGSAPTGYLDAALLSALGVAASAVPVGVGGGTPAGGAGSPDASLTAAALQAETALWQSIQSRPTVAMYEAYLAQYPNGTFAAVARLAAAALRADPPPASRPTGAVGPPSRPAAASDPRPSRRSAGERFSDCAECPELVVVPAGTFTMGSPSSEAERYDDEEPQHRVTIPSPLAVGVYEVTFAEWGACVSAGGCGGHRPDDEGWGRGARPVVNVSWDDAKSYVRWLSSRTGASYRLLSESEWEYVARGGTTTSRYWGASSSAQCGYVNGADRAVDCDDGAVQTAPVGSYRANGFGLYDVLGNVHEWVEDCWHGSYAGAPADGSAWTAGGDCGLRVLRGGSWDRNPRGLRSASRRGYIAGLRFGDIGFRVSRTFD